MTPCRPGDVVLLTFPFTDESGAKRRPALVLLDTGDEDAVVARITGQSYATRFDVRIAEWQRAGLLLPSVVRVHKVATIDKRLIEQQLGRLTDGDWERVSATARELWASN